MTGCGHRLTSYDMYHYTYSVSEVLVYDTWVNYICAGISLVRMVQHLETCVRKVISLESYGRSSMGERFASVINTK